MFKQMNMGGLNGTLVGIDLEHKRMFDVRKQLHCEIVDFRNELEDQMLRRAIAENEIPSFAFDGFYTDM